jgi:hypothetical protein
MSAGAADVRKAYYEADNIDELIFMMLPKMDFPRF